MDFGIYGAHLNTHHLSLWSTCEVTQTLTAPTTPIMLARLIIVFAASLGAEVGAEGASEDGELLDTVPLMQEISEEMVRPVFKVRSAHWSVD